MSVATKSSAKMNFKQEGFYGPITAFTEEEMSCIAGEVVAKMNRYALLKSEESKLYESRNRHLNWDLISKICRHPRIIESASQILSTQTLKLWRSHIFLGSLGKGIPYHQDKYNGILSDNLNHLIIHLALNESTPKNSLMILPGSHKMSLKNLREKGFILRPDRVRNKYGAPVFDFISEAMNHAHSILLKPGEFVILHPNLLHGSVHTFPKTIQFMNSIGRFFSLNQLFWGVQPKSFRFASSFKHKIYNRGRRSLSFGLL